MFFLCSLQILKVVHDGVGLGEEGADRIGQKLDEGAVRRLLLVLDEQAGHTGVLILADGADHVQGVAEAAFRICEDRDIHGVTHVFQHGDRLVDGQKTGVRGAQDNAVHAVSGGSHDVKARRLDGFGT